MNEINDWILQQSFQWIHFLDLYEDSQDKIKKKILVEVAKKPKQDLTN